MSERTYDLIVIGAGAIGVTIAKDAAEQGLSTAIIEAGSEVGAGCSYANAGLLAPSHAHPLTGFSSVRAGLDNIANPYGPFRLVPSPENVRWIARFLLASLPREHGRAIDTQRRLSGASTAIHRTMAESGLATGFRQAGLLDVYREPATARSTIDDLHRHPLRPAFSVLNAAQLANKLPTAVGMEVGVLTTGDAHCDGYRYVRVVSERAAELGVEFHFNEPAEDLIQRNNVTTGVSTEYRDLKAEHTVVAAAEPSKRLLRPSGLHLPLINGKGYVVDLAKSSTDPDFPIGIKDEMIVATPYPDRLRLAGVMELTGSDSSVDHRRVGAMIRAGESVFSGLSSREVIETWAGLRPCVADGLPVVGRTHDPGLSVATGHGQQGLVLAPITSAIVLRQMRGQPGTPSGVDPRSISPERFRRR
ncbi:NAD(P)/FAD-dependent oxidoreductase [Brevibacterium renqingii]|uniref:NAD(P)/FAD-dependent oxidoreductase n=1 Tax=Brevibacterium renqingii TaxID=2776916 RepID=UPI001ADF82A7|nr:FAD-dependent oxidoreductase [Brevibacterium renqingii]